MSIELPKMREAFEAWAKKDEWDYSLVRFDNGNYANYKTLMAWLHWQAAWQEASRLALEAAAVEADAWGLDDRIGAAIRALAAPGAGKGVVG